MVSGCQEEYIAPDCAHDECPWLSHTPEHPDDDESDPGNPPIWQDFGCISLLGTDGCSYKQPLEASYLASLKVKPRKGGTFYEEGFPEATSGSGWNKRQKYILTALAQAGYITPMEVLAAYPWIPQFVYPDPGDEQDWRNQWFVRRQELRDQGLLK